MTHYDVPSNSLVRVTAHQLIQTVGAPFLLLTANHVARPFLLLNTHVVLSFCLTSVGQQDVLLNADMFFFLDERGGGGQEASFTKKEALLLNQLLFFL